MTDKSPEFFKDRSLAFVGYVKRLNQGMRELRFLNIGLAATLAGCLLMEVLLGKLSDEHVTKTGPGERIVLIFAIVFFLFYKWREKSHFEALSDIEGGLPPDERIVVRVAVPTET